MIKLIVTDLDGTLLHHTEETVDVRQGDLDALKRFMHNGGDVVIASGRNFDEIVSISEQYGIGSFYISSNGAYCAPPMGEALFNQHFPHEDSETIFSLGDEVNVYRIGSDDRTYYCENKDEFLEKDEKRFGNFHIDMPDLRHRVKEDIPLRKVMFLGQMDVLEGIQQTVNETHPHLDALITSPISLEIVPTGVSKGRGIEALCETLDLEPHEIAVIGDGENDIPMFHTVSHSFTFPDVRDNVKEAARYVVDSIEEMVTMIEEINSTDK